MPFFKSKRRNAGGFLGFLDNHQRFFARLHINYGQMRLILKYKLLLDLRDTSMFSQLNRGNSKKEAKSVWGSLWYYGLYGVFMAFILLIPAPFSRYSYFFLAYFVLLFTSLLSGFSSILLDPRDRQIIGVRGVDDRTLNAARLIHISYYVGIIVTFLAAPGTILLLRTHSLLTPFAFALVTILFTLFTLVLALLLYFAILHIFSGNKLKNMINIFQVGFMIIIYLAGQIPNLVNQFHIGFSLVPIWHWWSIATIPFWFAAPLAALEAGWTKDLAIYSGAAVLGLIFSLVYYYRISAHFEASIQKMTATDSKRPRIGLWQQLMGHLFAHSALQRNYFNLAWRLNQTERDYHLRVYPALGVSFFAALLVLVNFGISMNGLVSLMNNKWLLLSGYALTLGLPQVVINLQFSNNPTAVSVFKTIPNFQAGQLRTATISATFARLILPQGLLMDILLTALLGWQFPLMGLNVLLFSYIIMAVLAHLYLQQLPFSQKFTANRAGELGWAYGFMAFLASMAGVAINALFLTIPGIWGNLSVTIMLLLLVGAITWQHQRSMALPSA